MKKKFENTPNAQYSSVENKDIFLENMVENQIQGYKSKWLKSFLTTNPQDALKTVTCPVLAIFGEKDFQQLFLIKKLVKDSNLPIEIIAAPTIRETDGLAMSSRNIRLTEAERIAAGIISKALTSAAKESSLELQRDVLLSLLASEKQFALDYAEIIDEESYEIADSSSVNTRAIVAGWINGVRLLDNMVMRSQVHKVGAR